MDAEEMKNTVVRYALWERGFPVAMKECRNEDVLAIDREGRLWHFEVKLSISDLYADGRKSKHRVGIKQVLFGGAEPGYEDMVPARFYFVLPQDLTEKAKDIVKRKYPYAGILTVYSKYTCGVTLRPGQWIHKIPMTRDRLLRICSSHSRRLERIASE